MSTPKKGYFQQRAEEAVRKTPYVRQPKTDWMEEVEEELEELMEEAANDPNTEWQDLVDREMLRLERAEQQRFGEVRSTQAERRAYIMLHLGTS